jgi:hypothetical protein
MTDQTVSDQDDHSPAEPRRRYTWPWWVLGAFVLAVVMSVLWMSREIARTRQIRDLNAPSAPGDQAAPVSPVLWMSREIARTRQIRDLNAPSAPGDQAAPVSPRQ